VIQTFLSVPCGVCGFYATGRNACVTQHPVAIAISAHTTESSVSYQVS
jgi:hypothetical protein